MQKDIFKRIESLKVQGATSIAIESLVFLKRFCSKNGFGQKFMSTASKLENLRPTAVVLHNCLDIIKKEKNLKAIDKLLEQMKASRNEIANHGQRIIKKKSVIMTHCHSSDAMAVIKAAKKKKIRVIATETEPKHQGIITSRGLAKAGIHVSMITDSAAGYYMPDTDMVIVGADAIRKEGVVNKIGTLPLAITSKEFNKPFYVAASSLKLDRRKNFKIEMRKPSEVYHKLKGVKILNPAFDITPWKYVAGVITENGIKTPRQIRRLL